MCWEFLPHTSRKRGKRFYNSMRLSMVKSPLRYPGGKSRAVSLIGSLIPSYKEFREPFIGGGSVYIHQQQLHPQAKFWINDLYRPLFLFWLVCKNNPHQLVDAIRKFRSRFADGKELFFYLKTHHDTFTDTEKAAAFFIFNRITFSGTSDSGGFSQAAFKGRFTESSIVRVEELIPIIRHTHITNVDYGEVVQAVGEEVFVFLDPPYFSATKSALYGKNGHLHKGFDHLRFAETMKACPHRWLITYDDTPFIRELFSFANIMSWDLTYGMRNVAKGADQIGKELFISNYIGGDVVPEGVVGSVVGGVVGGDTDNGYNG